MMIPILTGKNHSGSARLTGWGITAGPSLSLSDVVISYFNRQRMLVNLGVGAGAFFLFSEKSSLSGLVSSQFYEDEYTLSSPVLRITAMMIYNRNVSQTFLYRLGTVYTFIFGNPLLLPVAGITYRFANESALNILVPFNFSYRTHLNRKVGLMVFIHPQGGLNRFSNKLNFPSNAHSVLLLRRRSLCAGIGVPISLKNNLIIIPEVSLIAAQRVIFTEGFSSGSLVLNPGGSPTAPAFQLAIRLNWRPWQNNIRNKEKIKDNDFDDPPDAPIF